MSDIIDVIMKARQGWFEMRRSRPTLLFLTPPAMTELDVHFVGMFTEGRAPGFQYNTFMGMEIYIFDGTEVRAACGSGEQPEITEDEINPNLAAFREGLRKAAFLSEIRKQQETMNGAGRHDVAYGLELALELGEKML